MNETKSDGGRQSVSLKDAVRFWERQRVWYNAVLVLIVALWVVFTWPHFRPAMNLVALGKMMVLALLANLCYCAGYAMEGFIQPLLAREFWERARWIVWAAGTLLAVVLSNYWIADEIYPDVQQNATSAISAGSGAGGLAMASNVNFPAAFGIMGFLGTCFALFLAVAAVVIFWLARKRKFARYGVMSIALGTVAYFALLFGFSAGSRASTLTLGQEKYFCEIDCHLAYSVTGVSANTSSGMSDYIVTLRTRFDEKTISPQRPKDAPLTPSPREVRLVDSLGREYVAIATSGTSLLTPLIPGESYTTQIEFRIPKDAGGLRLLLNTIPAWPDRLVIGDENSLGHKKTYFAL
jgi:hypothetical protein